MAQLNINPIQWHEGMLLMPQHFQQADLRMERMITYYLSHIFPYFWGVIQLRIDEALLTTGIFRPLELEVIMPDGLLISSLPETKIPLQVELLPFQDKIQENSYFVYLCVPQWRGDDRDVTGEMARYQSSLNTNVVDINTGQQGIDIPRLAPNLSLQVGQEPPEHYTSLPIAQVTYDTKSFSLTEYVPPLVQVSSLSIIGQICGQLAFRLRQKLGYLQQKVQSVGDRVTKDPFFEELEEIRLKLVAGLLPFEAVLVLGNAHPFSIYRELCSLAGQISGIKYGELPPRFDAYNHQDVRKSFEQVVMYIDKVLDEIEESYTVVPFDLNERVFTLQLRSSWVGDRLVLGARAQPNMATEDLLNWINNCVIVTDKYITIAKDNRVLGAERNIVSEVPSMNLVPVRGIQLFLVEMDPQYIDPKGVLCIFNISDNELTRPVELFLYNANEQSMNGAR